MRLHWINQEDGYSLVETLVALAILLAVLVPSAMFLTYIGNNVFVKDKIESFQLAQSQMEEVIATRNEQTLTFQVNDIWWVKRSVTREGDLIQLKVEVFKRDTTSTPKIKLETARLWYDK
jgi:Tfp pilus assembly protein PilV